MKGKLTYLLVGASVLTIVLLAILPSTGWLVQLQLGLLVSPRAEALLYGGFGMRDEDPEASRRFRHVLQEAARKHPDDYRVQLGYALWAGEQPYESLKRLLARFGRNHPALYAHLLRFAVEEGVKPNRPEEALLGGARAPAAPMPTLPPPPAHLLREFDLFAREGERLDPSNAYFPMMRAMGLFAARRDQEAVDALLRASKCARWDDYRSDESLARIALLRAAFGEVPAVAEVVAYTVVFFWHHAALRSMARMAVYMAQQAERRGRTEESIEIRLALMRCGHLMRVHGTSLIANLVGAAISAMGAVAPGGTPPPPNLRGEERIKWNRQRFVEYLRKAGRATEATWAEQEFRRVDEQRALSRQAIEADQLLQRLSLTAGGWAVSLFLLQWVLALVILWAIYALLARARLLGEGAEPVFVLPVALLLIGGVLWMSAISAGASAFLAAMHGLQVQQQAVGGWFASVLSQLSQRLAEASPTMVRLLQVVLVLLTTLLAAGILATLALFGRHEGEHPLALGLRRYALPLAGVLLLLYAMLAVYTAHVENSWKREITLRIQHEGRFLAQQAGKQWHQ